MSAYSSRLFRAVEYRSRLQRLAVTGPSHAAYLSAHPDERAARLGCMGELEKEIASADIEGCDREALLRELDSYRRALRSGPEDGEGLSALIAPWRDVAVVAASAYAGWKGRGWLEQKIEEINRRQAAYVVEELERR